MRYFLNVDGAFVDKGPIPIQNVMRHFCNTSAAAIRRKCAAADIISSCGQARLAIARPSLMRPLASLAQTYPPS